MIYEYEPYHEFWRKMRKMGRFYFPGMEKEIIRTVPFLTLNSASGRTLCVTLSVAKGLCFVHTESFLYRDSSLRSE